MTTHINTVQLIADMEKVAGQLTQLIADMKGAAAQVLADKAFVKVVSELPEKSERKAFEDFEEHILKAKSQPAMMTKLFSGTGAAFTATPESISSAISNFTFPDISEIISEIKSTGLAILGKDLPTITGFSKRQLTALAKQAKLVAQGITSGEITEETQEFLLNSLKEMAENFVQTLQGILDVLIEKFLNAVIGILWKAIETAVGFKLPSLS